MTSRRLLTLSIAAILAIVIGLWLATRQAGSGGGEPEALYPKLKEQLDSLTAVRIYKAGDALAVQLQKQNDDWTVSERSNYPADESKLSKLVLAIAEAKPYEQKTSKPEQYPSLGVEDTSKADASGIRIELVGPAEPVNLIVGRSGPGTDSHYVRRAGEAQSWLIDEHIDTSSTPEAWLRKNIIDVSADRIHSATVTHEGAKPYTAIKTSRADANFKVEKLPKGKKLKYDSVANTFATALSAFTLSDVRPASEFESIEPTDTATFKTFDGLVVSLKGWTRDDKHYVALEPTFDSALAERFKIPTAPEEKSKGEGEGGAKKDDAQASGEGSDAKTEDKKDEAESAKKPSVEEEAKQAAERVAGWVYEIPQYKYESLFKPLDQLVE
ncbi:MAG TPA: DUF4340 domain-containing protein [Steroidobacteraceae bacterium]